MPLHLDYAHLYHPPQLPLRRARRGRMAAHEPGDVARARDALPRRARARHRRAISVSIILNCLWTRRYPAGWSTRSSCTWLQPEVTRVLQPPRYRGGGVVAVGLGSRAGKTSCSSTHRCQLRLQWWRSCLCCACSAVPSSAEVHHPAHRRENARIFWLSDITDEHLQRIDELDPSSAKAVSIPTPSTSGGLLGKPAKAGFFLRSLRRSMRKTPADRLANDRRATVGSSSALPLCRIVYRNTPRLRAGHPRPGEMSGLQPG